jgi:hypothetical protein
MNCRLTKRDCREIYHSLGLVRARILQLRLGEDGEQLASGKMELNRTEAETIYRALADRRERILRGAYDSYPNEAQKPGSVTFEMAEQVERILANIGYLGKNLLPKIENFRPAPAPGVEELRASLFAR